MCALQRVCLSGEAGVLTTRAAGECSHRRIRRQSRHPSAAPIFRHRVRDERAPCWRGGKTSEYIATLGRRGQADDGETTDETVRLRARGLLPSPRRRPGCWAAA